MPYQLMISKSPDFKSDQTILITSHDSSRTLPNEEITRFTLAKGSYNNAVAAFYCYSFNENLKPFNSHVECRQHFQKNVRDLFISECSANKIGITEQVTRLSMAMFCQPTGAPVSPVYPSPNQGFIG